MPEPRSPKPEALTVSGNTLTFHGKTYRCAVGRSGIVPAGKKREGDGATPAGTWRLRECWFRPDRLAAPRTALPLREITPDDCWCDDPNHPLYNQHFTSPSPLSSLSSPSPLSPLSSPSPLGGESRGGGRLPTNLTPKARILRSNMTDAEKLLWHRLRRKQLLGHTFRRQHPFGGRYIADFICLERKLVIELDGGQHDAQRTYDEKRDHYFTQEGYRVLRFWNNDVTGNMEGVLQRVAEALATPSLTLPPAGGGNTGCPPSLSPLGFAPSPCPLGGEGRGGGANMLQSFEHLWRDDHAYDLIIPLGYNDDPVIPGHGSAIFLHIAQPDYAPTEGCVALTREDLLEVLEGVNRDSRITIRESR